MLEEQRRLHGHRDSRCGSYRRNSLTRRRCQRQNCSLVMMLQVQQWLKTQPRRLKEDFGIDVRNCLTV